MTDYTPDERLDDAIDEIDGLEAEVERLREHLRRIERLRAKWDAPLDVMPDSDRRWAAVGSEAHKIATLALSDERQSAGLAGKGER